VRALTTALSVLGVGFLVANLRMAGEYVRFLKRRRGAVLVWPGPRPAAHAAMLAVGSVLGLLIVYKILVAHVSAFGETMMFIYYAYLQPLSRRISRGFYEDGIWADSVFIPYNDVGGIRWREGEHTVSLVILSRLKNIARGLRVPVEHYAAARRLLRDKIGQRQIQLAGTGLDLGVRDDRDDL
jgi:hypothetical protein